MSFASRPLATKGRRPRTRRTILYRAVDRALPLLPAGHLRLTLPNGETIERQGECAGPDASIAVHRWRGLWRMMLHGEHGFSDAYLDGNWSTPELSQLLEFCVHNESALMATAASGWVGLPRKRISHWLRANTRRGSRRNIAAHYDLGNEFFRPWLDAGMNYSSALFVNCDTLERAQDAKLDRAASLLDLNGGERVLEIGCGWGAFAERLIRRYGASGVGVTLLTQQTAFSPTPLGGGGRR